MVLKLRGNRTMLAASGISPQRVLGEDCSPPCLLAESLETWKLLYSISGSRAT